jgi:aromatic ring-opening dioxygenase catalytic subunit (LigB family)
MADLVFAGATSHVSGILKNQTAHPDRFPRLAAAWEKMTADIAAADPDIVIVIATDHYETFGPDNYPTFCVGAAPEYEPWNEFDTPGQPVTGDEQAGLALHTSLVRQGFDASRSQQMRLDHSFLVPIQRLRVDKRRIVPLFVNCNTPPMPSLSRCRDLGLALRHAIEQLPGELTVAIVATGGVSHWVGLPRMGEINEHWDHTFLSLMEKGALDTVLGWSDEEILETAGNGALEIRTWIVAAACAGPTGGTLLAYAPMHDWVTGIGILELEVSA